MLSFLARASLWATLLVPVAAPHLLVQSPPALPQLVGTLESGFQAVSPTNVSLTREEPLAVPHLARKVAEVWKGSIPLPHLVGLPQGGEMPVLLVKDALGQSVVRPTG